MDQTPKEDAERRLALLEVVLAALERRQEVFETLWTAHDRDDAAERLRVLLGIEDGTPPEVVLDMQLARLTTEDRRGSADQAAELRRSLGPE